MGTIVKILERQLIRKTIEQDSSENS